MYSTFVVGVKPTNSAFVGVKHCGKFQNQRLIRHSSCLPHVRWKRRERRYSPLHLCRGWDNVAGQQRRGRNPSSWNSGRYSGIIDLSPGKCQNIDPQGPGRYGKESFRKGKPWASCLSSAIACEGHISVSSRRSCFTGASCLLHSITHVNGRTTQWIRNNDTGSFKPVISFFSAFYKQCSSLDALPGLVETQALGPFLSLAADH